MIKNLLNAKLQKTSSVSISHILSTRKIDDKLENAAKITWEQDCNQAVASGKQMWDSNLYRLEDISNTNNQTQIIFSEIKYSIRKTLSKFTTEIENLGLDYASKGCFSSLFIKTRDNKYVFIEKSDKYITNKKYSFVGGVMCKDECEINTVDALFFSAEKEITEEIGVDLKHILNNELVSVYLTDTFNYCFLYITTIELTFEEVLDAFKKSNDGEAKAVIGIDDMNIETFKKQMDEKDQVKFDWL